LTSRADHGISKNAKENTMIKTGFIAAALAVASLGAATTPAAAQTSISVQIGQPPPPRYEVVPVARPGHLWVPGHWEWRGNRHTWVAGYYMRARPGYYYTQPTYVQYGNRWDYRPGHWSRGEARGHGHGHGHGHANNGRGDRDRDGVPNGRDRDRDGDGVANRNDRQPNNPRRN